MQEAVFTEVFMTTGGPINEGQAKPPFSVSICASG